MSNRNEIIDGLQKCAVIHQGFICESCEYTAGDCAVDDAIAMLKAQKETIPIDFLMRYAQLPTEFAISAWKKPIKDALEKKAKDTDKPMSFDDALQLVNGILSINRSEEW